MARYRMTKSEQERYGLTEGSGGVRGYRASGGTYYDPRLRGLSPGSVGQSSAPNSLTQARHAITVGDPYAQVARRELELGARMPLPYQAATALAKMPSMTGKPVEASRVYEDLYSPHAANPAHSVAGQRQTQWGTFGSQAAEGENWWDARHRMGYGQMGWRGSGYSEEWDTPLARERTAGRLEEVGSFDQKVNPMRPYLQLRARGRSVQPEGVFQGNALIRVTAGNFEDGQGVQQRQFLLGGGFVGAFDLMNWNNVRIEILEILDDTFVEFAWTSEGLAGDNRSLYFPQSYTTSLSQAAVPEGAYGLIIENPNPAVAGTTVTVTWISYVGGVPFTFTQGVSDNSSLAVGTAAPNVFFGNIAQVLGTTFRIGTSVDMVWVLRPI